MSSNSGANLAFDGMDLLSTAVLALDAQHQIVYVNISAEQLLANDRKTLLKHGLSDVLRVPGSLLGALEDARDNHRGYSGQVVEVKLADNSLVHLGCTITPLYSEAASGSAQVLLELQPVDRQLEANRSERLLAQQKANQELISNLAHEIKNPLGGIRGAAQLLEHELTNPALGEYTQIIIQEVDRLRDFLQRILSPGHVMRLVPMNMHEILERVHALLAAEYPQINFYCDYDASLPELVGDREQLLQSLLNIGKNAVQAMLGAQTKAPRLSMQTRALRQVTLGKRRFRLGLEIRISDNGPGIDTRLRERLFYPLVSGREDGAGLGLSIAQDLIQQHHGEIDFESAPGNTVFVVRLPLETAGEITA